VLPELVCDWRLEQSSEKPGMDDMVGFHAFHVDLSGYSGTPGKSRLLERLERKSKVQADGARAKSAHVTFALVSYLATRGAPIISSAALRILTAKKNLTMRSGGRLTTFQSRSCAS